MLYKLTKKIKENGGATKEDLKELEPFLSTGPIKFDNSRFYKNVEFIKSNYDILDYVTREIDVSGIVNPKLAELVFYLNVLFGVTTYDAVRSTFKFESNHHQLKDFFNFICGAHNFWTKYYTEDEEPFVICSFQGMRNIMASHISFPILDDKIIDLLLSLIYTKYIFKITEAVPTGTYSEIKRGFHYKFTIDHRSVGEMEFKSYRNKVSKFLDTITTKYEIKGEKDE